MPFLRASMFPDTKTSIDSGFKLVFLKLIIWSLILLFDLEIKIASPSYTLIF